MQSVTEKTKRPSFYDLHCRCSFLPDEARTDERNVETAYHSCLTNHVTAGEFVYFFDQKRAGLLNSRSVKVNLIWVGLLQRKNPNCKPVSRPFDHMPLGHAANVQVHLQTAFLFTLTPVSGQVPNATITYTSSPFRN